MEEKQGERSDLRVSDYVQQRNNVGTSGEILKNLDLSLNLLLLDRLENLDDTLLVVDDVDAFENFGIFAPTYIATTEWINSVESFLHNQMCGQGSGGKKAYRFFSQPHSSPTPPSLCASTC